MCKVNNRDKMRIMDYLRHSNPFVNESDIVQMYIALPKKERNRIIDKIGKAKFGSKVNKFQ